MNRAASPVQSCVSSSTFTKSRGTVTMQDAQPYNVRSGSPYIGTAKTIQFGNNSNLQLHFLENV